MCVDRTKGRTEIGVRRATFVDERSAFGASTTLKICRIACGASTHVLALRARTNSRAPAPVGGVVKGAFTGEAALRATRTPFGLGTFCSTRISIRKEAEQSSAKQRARQVARRLPIHRANKSWSSSTGSRSKPKAVGVLWTPPHNGQGGIRTLDFALIKRVLFTTELHARAVSLQPRI